MSGSERPLVETLRERAEGVRRDTYALYLAYKDPHTPWYARAWAAIVVAYALSPIDLIPDVLPLIGYLDDLVLVPLGFALALKLIPPDVMAEARKRATDVLLGGPPKGARIAALIVVLVWIVLALLAAMLVWRTAHP